MIANTTSYITSPTTVQKACGNCQTTSSPVASYVATSPNPTTIPTWIYLLIALLIILIVIFYIHKEKKSE